MFVDSPAIGPLHSSADRGTSGSNRESCKTCWIAEWALVVLTRWRFRRELHAARLLAEELEAKVFPAVSAQRGSVQLFLGPGGLSWDVNELHGPLPQSASLTHLATFLRTRGLKILRLDTRLESGQIVDVLTYLLLALNPTSGHGRFEEARDRLRAELESQEGMKVSCSISVLSEGLVEVRYWHCRLWLSRLLEKHLQRQKRQRDHRSLFRLAPRLALLAATLAMLAFVSAASLPASLSVVVKLLTALLTGAVVWVTVRTLGAVVYDREHSDILVESTFAQLRESEARLSELNVHLEDLVTERTLEVQQTQDATIMALAGLAELRDPETLGHLERTRDYVKMLALELRRNSAYADLLDDRSIDLLHKSIPLHDVGKIGLPDSILLKPGRLTAAEYEAMKRHTLYGGEALRRAEERLGSSSFLRFARDIATSHHERWDGTGYPFALKGDEIPLSARLMAVADVYDALSSKRVYKDAREHEDVVRSIVEGRGSHFDPAVVDAFLRIEDSFRQRRARTRSPSQHPIPETVEAVFRQASDGPDANVTH